MSFTVTVSLLPLCRQSRKLTQLLYHAYLPILFTTWNTLLPELYFRISRKISFLLLKKNEIFFKTSFPRTKIYDDGLHYVTKNMKVDLKLKKKKHNTEFETVFGFSVFKYCALCVSYLTTNFSDSHPTTRNLNVKILYDILITWWLF